MGRPTTRVNGERGNVSVFLVLLLPVLLGFTALLVDLGQLRATSRHEQADVDFAALAAGKRLSTGDAVGACRDLITYLNTNDSRISPAINAANFCSPISNICSNVTAPAQPVTTVGDVTVSVHYPVPANEISDSKWGGVGRNDGRSQCQRI